MSRQDSTGRVILNLSSAEAERVLALARLAADLGPEWRALAERLGEQAGVEVLPRQGAAEPAPATRARGRAPTRVEAVEGLALDALDLIRAAANLAGK